MNCLEVRYRVLRFLFGELPLKELAELRAHFEECVGCGECKVERKSIELILHQLTSVFDHEPVPEGLRKRIFAQFEQGNEKEN
jgi:hypothetical protein